MNHIQASSFYCARLKLVLIPGRLHAGKHFPEFWKRTLGWIRYDGVGVGGVGVGGVRVGRVRVWVRVGGVRVRVGGVRAVMVWIRVG